MPFCFCRMTVAVSACQSMLKSSSSAGLSVNTERLTKSGREETLVLSSAWTGSPKPRNCPSSADSGSRLSASAARSSPKIIAPDLRVIKSLVIWGYGVSVLPEYWIAEEPEKGLLHELWPVPKPVQHDLWLAYRTVEALLQRENV